MLIDAVDSYFAYVVQQMKIVSPAQMFGTVIQARSWPMTEPLQDTLYLLVVSAQPIGGTESQILYEILCQWTWISIGTNIQPTQIKENRGDRYRSAMAIIGNLRQANYPSFCAKQTVSAVNQQTGAVTFATVASQTPSAGGAESIWWSRLKMAPSQDNQKSGLVYGAAIVRVYCYDDVLASIE